jgi:16S rRNA processing protein RimM
LGKKIESADSLDSQDSIDSQDSRDSQDSIDSQDLVAIARTVRTRALRGEIVADLLTDFPERFEGLVNVIATDGEGVERDLELEKHWFQKDRVILKFKGFDSIEQAEDLLHLDICVHEEDAVELESDEYFDWQLEGCRVIADGGEIGTVTGVMRTGANENLEVSDGEKEYLIPFVEAICVDVDIDNKVIRAELPEGLLDL